MQAMTVQSLSFRPHMVSSQNNHQRARRQKNLHKQRCSLAILVPRSGDQEWRSHHPSRTASVSNALDRSIFDAHPILAVTDFAPIPAIVSHAFTHSLRVDPTEHPVLVTEPAWNTQANRERMAEIMFEEFHVPAFYISNTGVLNT
jgi:hypothetical protein